MNWINYISELNRNNREVLYHSNFSENTAQIENLKQQSTLHELPDELKELYRQTDGICEVIGDNVIGELIWPIQRVIDVNGDMRTSEAFKDLYMSFEQLLFFADAGNGDLFGFKNLNGFFIRNDVFVWNHEDDSRTWVAPNLKRFIDRWVNGEITV